MIRACWGVGALVAILCAAVAAAPAAVVLDPVADIPGDVPSLESDFVSINVDPEVDLGPMPRPNGDLSQGAETGDPNFYIEMSDMLKDIGARLVRCDPFSQSNVITLDEEGRLQIDFTLADAICDALDRGGAKPCWNAASWPEELEAENGYPPEDLWEEFVYRVIHHWNVEQKRNIQYVEFWNEPGGMNKEMFAATIRAARRADPSVKVGGPAEMGFPKEGLERTVKFCAENELPLGFLSWHNYYQMPEEFPRQIAWVKEMCAKYPGYENTEMLLTEWGSDAGVSGTCDTLYNAAYYLSVMGAVAPHWPRVKPMYFEVRDGWDGIGPSRDLWGRWGMITYPNLLPKPVYNAAAMWHRLGNTRIQAESSDPRIHVIAAKDPWQLTLLVWSWPEEYKRLLDKSLAMTTSVLDLPVRIRVSALPFAFGSGGVRYQRYVVDQTHGNVRFDLYSPGLEKVHDVILARTGPERGESPTKGLPEDAFETEIVMPLHGITLIVLRPEERPPVNVVPQADRFMVRAGERAKVTITPRFDENLDLELVADPTGRSQWKTEIISQKPLTFWLEPPAVDLKSLRYYTAWVRNRMSGAIGRAALEVMTDSAVRAEQPYPRIDVSPLTHKGRLEVTFHNKTAQPREGTVAWHAPAGVKVTPAQQTVRLDPNGSAAARVQVAIDEKLPPGRYPVSASLSSGCPLKPAEYDAFVPMTCAFAKRRPKIDGDLSDWRGVSSVDITGIDNFDGHGYREWGGPDDISGRAWAQWDDRNLYLAFEVRDDDHLQHVANCDMYKWDAVHVGFDAGRDHFDPNRYFEDGDCDYLFGYTDRAHCCRFWGAKRPMGEADGVTVAARVRGDVITYEIAMNWEKEFLPWMKPREGEVIGFCISLRDFDEGKHAGELQWGRGLRWDEKRPAKYWSMWLTR